jgi:hypothetical protein
MVPDDQAEREGQDAEDEGESDGGIQQGMPLSVGIQGQPAGSARSGRADGLGHC